MYTTKLMMTTTDDDNDNNNNHMHCYSICFKVVTTDTEKDCSRSSQAIMYT